MRLQELKRKKKIFFSALTFHTITSLQLIAEGLNKQKNPTFYRIGEHPNASHIHAHNSFIKTVMY